MSEAIEIRTELPGDVAEISAVIAAAFEREEEARLVEALRTLPSFDPALSLVAVCNGASTGDGQGEQIVGHILFTDILIRREDGSADRALALAPVALLPEWQRRGIGSRLTAAGLAACRARGDRWVIVVGHADFYPRFGFQSARARGLEVPFPVEDASFMVCDLADAPNDSSTDIAGMVEYPAPFQAV
ncbi:MAG TPA: N-acetyltransferase [Pirellulales bacterium]